MVLKKVLEFNTSDKGILYPHFRTKLNLKMIIFLQYFEEFYMRKGIDIIQ